MCKNAFYGVTRNKITANLVWRSKRDSLMCTLKTAVQYFHVKGLWLSLGCHQTKKEKRSMIFMTDCTGIKFAQGEISVINYCAKNFILYSGHIVRRLPSIHFLLLTRNTPILIRVTICPGKSIRLFKLPSNQGSITK